jgi:hypothetical protein
MALAWKRAIADSLVFDRWKGREPHGRSSKPRSQFAVVAVRDGI